MAADTKPYSSNVEPKATIDSSVKFASTPNSTSVSAGADASTTSAPRFVSGGTVDQPTERDEEWLQAQREIDQRSWERAEKAKGLLASSKSLFEQLQENKNKKLMERETTKEYRLLDEDEIEYLNSVQESTREKELALKRETDEQLLLFKQRQQQSQRIPISTGDKESIGSEETEIDGVPSSSTTSNTGLDNLEHPSWKVGPKKRKTEGVQRHKLGGIVKRARAENGSQVAGLSTQLEDGNKETGPQLVKKSSQSTTEHEKKIHVDTRSRNGSQSVAKSAQTGISNGLGKPTTGLVSLGLASYSDSDSDQ